QLLNLLFKRSQAALSGNYLLSDLVALVSLTLVISPLLGDVVLIRDSHTLQRIGSEVCAAQRAIHVPAPPGVRLHYQFQLALERIPFFFECGNLRRQRPVARLEVFALTASILVLLLHLLQLADLVYRLR